MQRSVTFGNIPIMFWVDLQNWKEKLLGKKTRVKMLKLRIAKCLVRLTLPKNV